MNSPFSTLNASGTSGSFKTWTQHAGDRYLATGTDRAGKRFRITSASWLHIAGINIWRGKKWLVRDGKRHLIQTIFN